VPASGVSEITHVAAGAKNDFTEATKVGQYDGIALNEHFRGDGAVIYKHACALGCAGIVSKRLGSPYKSGRVDHWLKIKNPAAPAVKREAEEDWAR
jgi:ATP-dependent DNA ligase